MTPKAIYTFVHRIPESEQAWTVGYLLRKISSSMPDKALTGRILREARGAAGISQTEASRLLCVHKSQMSCWENGHLQPSAETFNHLMTIYAYISTETNQT